LTIVADDRERTSGVVDALSRFPSVRVYWSRLSIGDYLVDHRFLIERKSLADFAGSIIDGRLFRQAAQMVRQKLRIGFILEGTAQDLTGPRVRREAMQGALITINFFYGIPVLRSIGPEETARLLIYIGQQSGAFVGLSLPRHGHRPQGKRKRQLFILQGLPDIGPKRAERLLAKFGTLQEVFNATYDQLRSIESIGDTRANRVIETIREKRSGYGRDKS